MPGGLTILDIGLDKWGIISYAEQSFYKAFSETLRLAPIGVYLGSLAWLRSALRASESVFNRASSYLLLFLII